MPGANDPEVSTDRSWLGKLTRRFGMNVNIRIDKVEGGRAVIKGIEIGALNISLPQQTWLVLIAILLPTFVVAFILLYPQIVGPGPMNHDFNIAVADFGEIDEQGRVVPSADAARLSDSIFYRLTSEFEAIPDLDGRVEVRHSGIGLIDTEEAARKLTEKDNLNASLVVYGSFQLRGNQKVLVPVFYVRDLRNAEELVGPSEFGGPVSFKGSPSTADALGARCGALTRFAIGLTYFTVAEYDDALKYLDEALKVPNLKDVDGKEVIYSFLGSAYNGRASAQNSLGDLALARNAYTEALKINPEYSRAYVGLGNVAYEEYRLKYMTDPSQADPVKLDDAIISYTQALTAVYQPATANVAAKVHYNLGNVYNAKAQAGHPALFEKARAEFKLVADEYEQDMSNANLRPIAAQAYCGLGVIEERATKNYERAAEYYQECHDNAEDYSDIQAQADRLLDSIKKLRQ